VYRILIAEDESRIASFLEKGLKANGFSVTTVTDGQSTIDLARSSDFDLLILDLGLPDIDGQEVLRRIRARGERLPVVILTARQGVEDTISGLESGADDYVTKPFVFDELLARIRARLRIPGRSEQTVLEAGGIELDLRTRRVMSGDRVVELSPKEFQLLETLIHYRGQVLSREQLLSRVWGFNYDPGSNIVDVYIGYLRRKLGREMIETVRGMGYRFRPQ
jgi:DNA-binding response OmpR family regulator